MIKWKLTPLALVLSFTLPLPAMAAEDNQTVCGLYSSIGGSLTEFMLPLTMQDFVNIMTGKDPELLKDLSINMLNGLTGAELAALNAMDEDDSSLLSESAGQIAVNHLMSGSASSSEDVKYLMKNTCLSIGAAKIIENQRRANDATQANLGQ